MGNIATTSTSISITSSASTSASTSTRTYPFFYPSLRLRNSRNHCADAETRSQLQLRQAFRRHIHRLTPCAHRHLYDCIDDADVELDGLVG